MIRLLPIMLVVAFVVSALAGGVAYCQGHQSVSAAQCCGRGAVHAL